MPGRWLVCDRASPAEEKMKSLRQRQEAPVDKYKAVMVKSARSSLRYHPCGAMDSPSLPPLFHQTQVNRFDLWVLTFFGVTQYHFADALNPLPSTPLPPPQCGLRLDCGCRALHLATTRSTCAANALSTPSADPMAYSILFKD